MDCRSVVIKEIHEDSVLTSGVTEEVFEKTIIIPESFILYIPRKKRIIKTCLKAKSIDELLSITGTLQLTHAQLTKALSDYAQCEPHKTALAINQRMMKDAMKLFNASNYVINAVLPHTNTMIGSMEEHYHSSMIDFMSEHRVHWPLISDTVIMSMTEQALYDYIEVFVFAYSRNNPVNNEIINTIAKILGLNVPTREHLVKTATSIVCNNIHGMYNNLKCDVYEISSKMTRQMMIAVYNKVRYFSSNTVHGQTKACYLQYLYTTSCLQSQDSV